MRIALVLLLLCSLLGGFGLFLKHRADGRAQAESDLVQALKEQHDAMMEAQAATLAAAVILDQSTQAVEDALTPEARSAAITDRSERERAFDEARERLQILREQYILRSERQRKLCAGGLGPRDDATEMQVLRACMSTSISQD